MSRQLFFALFAFLVADLSLTAVVAGVILSHFGVLEPLIGFLICIVGMAVGGLVGVPLSLLALQRTKSSPGRGLSWIATAICVLLLVLSAWNLGQLFAYPEIHDITTDPSSPPSFQQASQLPANRGRDLSYPHGNPETSKLQREAYPDIQPLHLPSDPDQAFQRARAAAEKLGWSITWSNTLLRQFEATDKTLLFGFVDDIAVRVAEDSSGGSIIDLRSTSRVGLTDAGANAARIRRFVERAKME